MLLVDYPPRHISHPTRPFQWLRPGTWIVERLVVKIGVWPQKGSRWCSPSWDCINPELSKWKGSLFRTIEEWVCENTWILFEHQFATVQLIRQHWTTNSYNLALSQSSDLLRFILNLQMFKEHFHRLRKIFGGEILVTGFRAENSPFWNVNFQRHENSR